METNRGIPGTADFGRTTLGHDGHAGHPARPVCGCNSGRIEQLAGKRIWGTGTRGDKRGRPVGGIEARTIPREEGTAEFVGCESEIGTEAKLARKNSGSTSAIFPHGLKRLRKKSGFDPVLKRARGFELRLGPEASSAQPSEARLRESSPASGDAEDGKQTGIMTACQWGAGCLGASCRQAGARPPRRGHLHPIKPKTGLMGTRASGPTRAIAKLLLIRRVVPSPFRTRAATFSLLRGRPGCGRFWGRAVTRGSLPTQRSRAEAW